MSFGQKILKYRDEIIKDLRELIQIRSCTRDAQPGSFAGEEALDWILKKASSMGLATARVGNAAGHAEYGEGEELAAVLTHVDVVPAGDGWDSDPFVLTEKDGILFGRGVADDKGAAIIALYCLKVLQEEKVVPVRKLRTIFGAGEESGMNDMAEYFREEKLPDLAFTPDSNYGICNREKGILQVELSLEQHDGTTLTEFHAGGAINTVPDKAYVLLNCTENEDHQLQRLADAKIGEYEFRYTIDGLMIISKGAAAHAAEADRGFNAATHLIRLLSSNFGHKVLGKICAFIDATIGLEIHGASMGIKKHDKESGELTINVGTVDIGDKGATAKLDIRYPVTADGEEIFATIRKRAENEGIFAKIISHQRPLFLQEEQMPIPLLKQAYREITGKEPELYATGGGTYARTLLGKGVAFGPIFKGEEARLHNTNENIKEELLFLHAQICLEAMYRMLTEK